MVDSWQPGAFEMRRFAPQDQGALDRSPIPHPRSLPVVALRRFRHPVSVRVHMEHRRPSSVMTTRRGLSSGGVEACAGPWRTSGGWWESGIPDPRSVVSWDRDEWDVTLAGGATYRLFRDRHADRWFIEGVVD